MNPFPKWFKIRPFDSFNIYLLLIVKMRRTMSSDINKSGRMLIVSTGNEAMGLMLEKISVLFYNFSIHLSYRAIWFSFWNLAVFSPIHTKCVLDKWDMIFQSRCPPSLWIGRGRSKFLRPIQIALCCNENMFESNQIKN